MLALPAAAQAASYLPGNPTPDPPTGDTARDDTPNAAEPIDGGGIRWVLAPWRFGGAVALDLRTQRLGAGASSSQAVLYGNIDFATHVWQPWFIQLRAGLGLLQSTERSSAGDEAADGSRNTAMTGRFSVAVFPASRFPFELRAEANDSRTRGDLVDADYRSERLSLSQGWRPRLGAHRVQLNLDHSRLVATEGASDSLTNLIATSSHQWGHHSFDLAGSHSSNRRSDTVEASRLAALSARHSYQPGSDLRVETLVSENDTRLRQAGGAELRSALRQWSTLLSWRPREGQWLYQESAPLQVTGSLRWAGFDNEFASATHQGQSLNATLGVSKEWRQVWRFSGSASFGRFDAGGAPAASTASLGLGATWTPTVAMAAGWQYAPTVSSSASLARASGDDQRHSLGLQAAHSLSRNVLFGEGQSLTMSLTQSAAALRESRSAQVSTGLAHSGSLFWQSWGSSSSQTVVGLTLSDAITRADEDGRFQLVNLQVSRRTQLSRSESWSANLTLQATRNESAGLDPFSGQQRQLAAGWQQFHNGSLNYENQRFLGLPRLRLSVLLSANSQQLERRAAGDIDAPLQRVGRSLEARLDYAVGRLHTRLAARHAEIDGQSVSSLQAHLQRRF